MTNQISAKEYPLLKVFCSDFEYHIPSYQRPYSWEERHTETLIDNLYDFYSNNRDKNYFLGSIVLIKKDERKPESDVIDGQQRLTTLSIILACIASKLNGKSRQDCEGYLMEPGNTIAKLAEKPRLFLRKKDQSFFKQFIQEIQINRLLARDPETYPNEAQKHIHMNCKIIMERLEEYFSNDSAQILSFCQFLMSQCYLVVVTTADEESAWRIFSVMNTTGLDLSPTDIIKSEIIQKLPDADEETYTDKWEDMEIKVSRQGFAELFSHLRMIEIKEKAKSSLLDEFRKHILPGILSNPANFIDNTLEKYVDAFYSLKHNCVNLTNNSDEINNCLRWLNRIDNSDWLPCAIKFLADKQSDSDYVLWFIRNLERLASYLFITSKDINKRIIRYAQILTEMENYPNHDNNNHLKSIELSQEEKKEFISTLDGEIYKMTSQRRNYVILRLDSFVSTGGAIYDQKVLTIEHVLPQTVYGTAWENLWPNENDRATWLNRIANLVPLTRKKNSQAQNYDFDTKKNTYFVGPGGTSSYALTTQVLQETNWTKQIVEARQQNLINIFTTKWELS